MLQATEKSKGTKTAAADKKNTTIYLLLKKSSTAKQRGVGEVSSVRQGKFIYEGHFNSKAIQSALH